MEISSAENQFKLSKALFEQHSSNIKLICPQCKESTPLIEEIELSLLKRPLVRFSCKCLTKKKEEIIDLEQYMHILLMDDCSQKLCFKHPEEIASIYCANCSLNMCNLCYSYHVSFEPSHNINSIETENNAIPCPYHLNTYLDLYCADCNLNICIHCAKKIHFKHQVMQLSEYWERVNNTLIYQTNDSLNTFLAHQISKYHSYIQNQLEKINAIIFNLQQIKAKIEQKSKKIQKANQSIGLFLSLMFSEFFKRKSTPNFQVIQNIERIELENLILEKSANKILKKYARIDEEIKHLNINLKDSAPRLIAVFSKPIIPLKALSIEKSNRQYFGEQSKKKINKVIWMNEESNFKKKNYITSNNCSTNSTNEEKLGKIINKEEILKSLNIFSDKEEEPKHEIIDYIPQQFINNKTKRNEKSKMNQIPKKCDFYSQHFSAFQSKTNNSFFELKLNKNENKNVLLNNPQFKNRQDSVNQSVISSKDQKIQNKNASQTNFWNENINKTIISNDLIDLINKELFEKDENQTQFNIEPNKSLVSKAIQYDQCISTISHHSKVNAIAQLKTGHLISGGKDSVINIYDNNNFDVISKIETNNNQIYCITELYDGSIVVGLNDNSIKIYDSSNKSCMMMLIGHSKPVIFIIQKDISSIISSSKDNTIKIWDLISKQCLMTYDEHFNSVCGLIRVNEFNMISASKDSTLKLWNYSSNKSLHTIKAHSSGISTIIKLFNDQLATASADKTIKCWDENLETCKGVLIGHLAYVSSIVQLIDGNLASCSFDYSMKIWDLKTMTCINTIKVSSLKVYLLLQLFDGSIATVSDDSLIKIWI